MSQTRKAGLPPLNWLRAFEASARLLSFTGAAKELNMTQPAVSQQIKNLEGFLGKALFYRRVRALELTEAARLYLPTVQQAFETLAQGTQTFVGYDRGQSLAVQSNLAFSIYWLAPRLPDLYRKYPWISLDITTALWIPEESRADVEIRFGRSAGDGVAAERLTEETCYPVASVSDPERAEPFDLQRLADQQLFDCAGLSVSWVDWFAGQNFVLAEQKRINWASTFSVTLSAAHAGAGLALGHDTLVAGLLKEKRLQRLGDYTLPMAEAYFLLRPSPAEETPASKAFADWLLMQFNP
ncbi:LysR family transcriptional regulator [Rhodovibrionaceae bacterium A322]